MPTKKSMTPTEFNERRTRVQEALLIDMEAATERLRETQEMLGEIERDVIKKFRDTLKDGTITAYKACVAHAKLVDSVTKLENTRMNLYDRVSGVVGTIISMPGVEEMLPIEADGVEIDVLDERQCRLEAERCLITMINWKQERDAKLALESHNGEASEA